MNPKPLHVLRRSAGRATIILCAWSMTVAAWAADAPFRIQVVDEQTGRGVPLVTLQTVNLLSYVTDSNGIVAFLEPGLMNQTVYFHISSHGYDYPADGFGFRGKAIDITPGGQTTVRLKRLNIAERLYRVTGQGIYRDSLLTGDAAPLANPALNGQVVGQDSVCVARYNDTLYWFWGDTAKPSYPLGHFATAGATSRLPGRGGLDPSVGVDLTYFVDDKGFSKKMTPLPESGMVWIESLMTAKDPAGKTRLLTKYARLKSLSEAVERGLMVFNDDRGQFETILRGDPDLFLLTDLGHPLAADSGQQAYYYFAAPFPVGVRVRVKTDWDCVTDPNRYEIFTALHQTPPAPGYRWIASDRLLEAAGGSRAALMKAIVKEKQATCDLIDIDTAKPVTPHGGTVYWNDCRDKWVMIAVQQGGSASYLGEVWYAEADTPVGPWRYARKVVTHDAYSFYNPRHHPTFDQDGGRRIYFEGTYTHTFSGTQEKATPRYDYNQIMYRLDLADSRLFLPEPVYRVRTGPGRFAYRPARAIDREKDAAAIEAIAFYAMAPDRAAPGQAAVYEKTDDRGRLVLTTTRPGQTAAPLFYGLEAAADHPAAVELFAYRHRTTGQTRYSVRPSEAADGEDATLLCCVWQGASEAVIADWPARPADR